MSDGNSLINLGDVSKPAVVLIEKISDAIGGLFKPYYIRQIARAEADADRIKSVAQIEITELQQRALQRFVFEEAKKQANIEAIATKALPYLKEDANPNNVEDDWITNFFDKSRLISDEQMQEIWAKLLAGEANNPGSYSKRTIDLLSSLDKADALLFNTLCGFCCLLDEIFLLIYNEGDPIYVNSGVNFNALNHLDDIGLISFNHGAGSSYTYAELSKTISVVCQASSITIDFPTDQNNQLEIGRVIFTKAGQELAQICISEPVPDFLDYVLDIWKKKGLIVSSPYPRTISVRERAAS
ncbi:DUF2806 domain-containing protein [Phormidium sp. FACHB-592]|uniref:DUF2806 domain-containing protein n=1 Tax=Stenomitos frigidus AS-A4 TaxID=2933935 RepID=A0ABV0KM73_9CYAN|nr:DUF2806 domain-containing protein [Phormidium sp. FACHB-592]MBD2075083.1 DUF2806 domain-containing protein [Phormidium sp. FACHB-592]